MKRGGYRHTGELRLDISRSNGVYNVMLARYLPSIVELFVEKSNDYREDGFTDLGLKGQFSDMWRKMGKLKTSIWDGEKLKFESEAEILKDLFGHIIISLHLIDELDAEKIEQVARAVRSGVQTQPTTEPPPPPLRESDVWPTDTGRCSTTNMSGKRCRRIDGHEALSGVDHLF